MRTEHVARRVVLLCGLIAGGLGTPLSAGRSDPLPVNYSLEYQHVDGSFPTRDVWSQNIDALYARRLSSTLQLSSQFRLNRLTAVGHPEKTITPYGDLRLLAPSFGLTSSYRPVATTNQYGVTTTNRNGQFSAFVAQPGLPRVDVLWTRVWGRPEGLSLNSSATTRTARLSWAVGAFELRGGATSLTQVAAITRTSHTREVNWDGGAVFRRARSNWSFSASSDFFSGTRRSDFGIHTVSRAGSLDLDFNQKVTRKLAWNVSYTVRATRAGDGAQQRLTTHDGSANGVWQINHAAQMTVGLGVRPVSTPTGAQRTLGFAVATSTIQGRVRAGWTGVASASQTVNRQPAGDWFGTSSFRLGSSLTPIRLIRVDLDGTISANGDTAVRDARISTQSQVSLTARPLRPWTISASFRGYRAGRSLGDVAAHSTAQSLSLAWQPSSRVDLRGSLTSSGALPRGTPRLTTRTLAMRFVPSSRFQADAQVTSSNSTRVDASSGYLPGTEAWSGHLLTALGRKLTLRFGGSIVNPGQATRSRQVDATLTGRLGGGS